MSNYSYPAYTRHDLEEYKAYNKYKKYKRKYKALVGGDDAADQLVFLQKNAKDDLVKDRLSDVLGKTWNESKFDIGPEIILRQRKDLVVTALQNLRNEINTPKNVKDHTKEAMARTKKATDEIDKLLKCLETPYDCKLLDEMSE